MHDIQQYGDHQDEDSDCQNLADAESHIHSEPTSADPSRSSSPSFFLAISVDDDSESSAPHSPAGRHGDASPAARHGDSAGRHGEASPAGRHGDSAIRHGDSSPAGRHGDSSGRQGDTSQGGRHGDSSPAGRHGDSSPAGRHGDSSPAGRHGDSSPAGRHGDASPSDRHDDLPTSRHDSSWVQISADEAMGAAVTFSSPSDAARSSWDARLPEMRASGGSDPRARARAADDRADDPTRRSSRTAQTVTYITNLHSRASDSYLHLLKTNLNKHRSDIKIYDNRPRLLYHIEEPNVGRGFIKEMCFSSDGRLVCSPFAYGTRLLALDEKCSELCDVSPVRPRSFHEVRSCMTHQNVVLSTKFSPTHCLFVSGCLNGEVMFHQPVLS